MNWQKHRKKLLANPDLRRQLEATELEYQIAREIIAARVAQGLTQKDLAKRMGTKQSVISRVENAKTVPSISFLKSVANALHTSLKVQLGTA